MLLSQKTKSLLRQEKSKLTQALKNDQAFLKSYQKRVSDTEDRLKEIDQELGEES